MSMSETLTAPARVTVPFGYPTPKQALAVSPVQPACVPQDHLEPVLLEQLLQRGGTVRFGVELANLRQDADGVLADLRHVASGRHQRVRADYVIGADGPRSTTREELGIQVEDLGAIGDFVSVTFRADLASRMPRIPAAINAVEVAGAQGLFVPTSADDRGSTPASGTPRRARPSRATGRRIRS
jgi:2-polyprenyl-6-methoxyphenol hydroxylase-like FAD-dependent oxidoreductase